VRSRPGVKGGGKPVSFNGTEGRRNPLAGNREQGGFESQKNQRGGRPTGDGRGGQSSLHCPIITAEKHVAAAKKVNFRDLVNRPRLNGGIIDTSW